MVAGGAIIHSLLSLSAVANLGRLRPAVTNAIDPRHATELPTRWEYGYNQAGWGRWMAVYATAFVGESQTIRGLCPLKPPGFSKA